MTTCRLCTRRVRAGVVTGLSCYCFRCAVWLFGEDLRADDGAADDPAEG